MTRTDGIKKNLTIKTCHFKDDSGLQLDVMPDRKIKDGIRFNLNHKKLFETGQRKEFEAMTITIDSSYPVLYEALREFLIMTRGDRYNSKDPIRDGRNELFINFENEIFYITFVHDYANEFRVINRTGIVLIGKEVERLYEAVVKATEVPTVTPTNDYGFTTEEEIFILEEETPKVYKLANPLGEAA